MRKYPHGLEEEILPEDIEIEQETIDEYEAEISELPDDAGALMIEMLGNSYYATACYKYAMGESVSAIRERLTTASGHFLSSFKMDVALDVYEFIKMLSLSIVLGEVNTSVVFASATRDKYTDEGVTPDETVFTVAELMSAFVKRDENLISRIFERVNPDTVETKNIYRYDRLLYFPLLKLLYAVHQRDIHKFGEAWSVRNSEFIRLWRRADQKNDPDALIDINCLAIAVFAKQRNMSFSDSSVYCPFELIGANS